ncbi:MAG: hypothetical protein CVV57_06490 [Tenericutes bacterium HGW-Tenericutes-2]|jgi:uncharacterized ion transporter superfamily protein YfcC|nr:MAG: hypothetical protein CVV57_06490 [Tenericutes bacterium HGW-Tenericutes-2]
MTEQPNVLHISKKAFLSVVYILLGLIVIAGIMTLFIPSGAYLRDIDGNVIPNSFAWLDNVNYPIWRWFTAPFEVLWGPDALNIIVIGLFLIILGGTFAIMDKTGGIIVVIKKLIVRFKDNKYLLLRMVTLIFMMFGAFFGIFEESMALLPILIILSLSMGWDTLTGIGMCLLAAGFGFASAVTNPFSIGIASTLANTNILSGALYRIFIFIIMYLLLSTFLVRYAKKIEKNPSSSMTYESDLNKSKEFDLNQSLPFSNEKTVFKSFMWMFAILFVGIIGAGLAELFFDLSIPSIPIMAIIFLFGGFIAGIIVSKSIKFTAKTFLSGMISVAPAFVLIMLAVSVKHIITEAMIMDTILYYLATLLNGRSAIVGILFIYLLVLIIQFFIGSASAKAFLIMPLLLPLVSLIGISKELAILAFVFGDGYTNVIFPTNGVLLIGLSIAGVSYQKWFKFTYKLQFITLLLTIIFLVIAVWIGY